MHTLRFCPLPRPSSFSLLQRGGKAIRLCPARAIVALERRRNGKSIKVKNYGKRESIGKKKKERRGEKALSFSRRNLIVRGIWTVEQMGVSRRENRRNVILPEIISWLISFSFLPPLPILRHRDHPYHRSAALRKKKKKMILRIFHLFVINPYNRKTSTLMIITSNWGKKNFRSHRISGAALCILNGLFYHNSTRGSEKNFPGIDRY